MMKQILITGASGFIGLHLVNRLSGPKFNLRLFVRQGLSSRVQPQAVEVMKGDVRDGSVVRRAAVRCDTIFHLAAKAHVYWEEPGDKLLYRSVNVDGTRNVLEAAVAGGARRFVFFSSVKVMGEGNAVCLDEYSGTGPLTAYGWSKWEGEQLVFDYGKRTGLHVSCLRLPLVYGPGNKGNLYRMIAAIDRGFFPPLPEVNNRRSMVHVNNVVEAAILAAICPVANGQSYIVTDGEVHSTREIYQMICRALGKPIPRWATPVDLLRSAGRAGDLIGHIRGRRFLFDSDALEKLIGSAWYSSEKISRELGYHSYCRHSVDR